MNEGIMAEYVKIDRLELIDILKTNREKHVKEYDLAIAEFRRALIEELTVLVDSLKLNGPIVHGAGKNVTTPVSFAKEYDKAIRKYELHVDSHVFLDDHSFNQLVMDEWSWKKSTSNTFYAAASSVRNGR